MNLVDKISRRLYRYAVDIVNDRDINGWCFNRLQTNKPVVLEFYGDKDKLGETRAELLRPDVQARGVHPTGKCGFEFNIPADVDIGRFKSLSIRGGAPGSTLYHTDTSTIPRTIRGVLPRVLFMHIPKTAGTSFNTFARSYYPQDRGIIHIEAQDRNLYTLYNETFDYISGHLTLPLIRQYFDLERFDLYSLIREPYGHLHSHFNWVRSIADRPDSGFFHAHPEVVREMAVSMQNMDLSDPKVLEEFVRGLRGFGLDFFDNIQTRYFLDTSPEKVKPTHLDTVLRNLSCFKHVGLTEQYQAFSEDFCHQIGVKYCVQKTPLNKAKSADLFNYQQAETRRILLPLVETDMMLYEHVRAQSRASGSDALFKN